MVITFFCKSKHITTRLAELIEETNKGVLFSDAFSFTEAVQCLCERQPDVVILDIDFAADKTPELLKRIQQFSDETVVILLTGSGGHLSLKSFSESGADYLFDQYDDFEKIAPLIKTIRKRIVS